VVLICGGGITAAVLLARKTGDDIAKSVPTVPAFPTDEPTTPDDNATTPDSTGTPTTDSSEESVQGDLDKFKTGDCLTIDEANNNNVEASSCTATGAWKVLKRQDGTTSDSACDGTDATESLYQDASGTTDDFVLCVAPVK
jgi:hypothetical protein